MTWVVTALALVAALLVLTGASLRVIREYERGIVFRFGRLRPLLGPGPHLLLPLLNHLVRVDLRVVTLTIPPQEIITKDNVPARVNAVVLFQVLEPEKSVMAVENFAVATSQIAQTSLRSVLGRVELDTLLAHRSDLNEDLRATIDTQTGPWGVSVKVVEIKDVEIPEAMQRAMAREAEAGAGAARQDHQRPRRAAGLRGAAPGRRHPQPQPGLAAAALPADPARARRRPELHRGLPAPDRHHRPLPVQAHRTRRSGSAPRRRAGLIHASNAPSAVKAGRDVQPGSARG